MSAQTDLDQSHDMKPQVDRAADRGGAALLAVTVVLLLIAVTLSVAQKYWEGQAAIGVATQLPTTTVASEIHRAAVVQVISIVTALLAIATWGWAYYRRESNFARHLSVPTLLVLFSLIQLLLV